MRWFFGIFFGIILYLVVLVFYFALRCEVQPKGLIQFGVTIPRAYLEDERLQEIRTGYMRRLKLSTAVVAILPFALLFSPWVSIAFLGIMLWVLILLVCIGLPYVWANKQTARLKREASWTFPYESTGADAEDRYWKWGMIYYNPGDKAGLVTSRMGVGTTVNLAKSWAKLLFGACMLFLLAMFPVGGWLMAEEFTPVYLNYEDGVVIAGQLRDNYRIPEASIEEVKLVRELPRMSKKTGSGLSNLRKGTYHIRNVGDCEILVNPQNQYTLYIRTAGREYYLGDASDEQTRKIYEEITDSAP